MALLTGCQATRMLARGRLQGAEKLLKQRAGVVRARRRLGVILHPEHRQLTVAETLDRPIVQVDVGNLEMRGAANTLFVALNREPMVLRSYENPSRLHLPNGMITTSVPIGHLRGLTAESESQKLVSEADPKGGYTTRGQ